MVRKKIDGIFVDENLILVGKKLEKLPDVDVVLYPGHPDIPELPLSAKDVEYLRQSERTVETCYSSLVTRELEPILKSVVGFVRRTFELSSLL